MALLVVLLILAALLAAILTLAWAVALGSGQSGWVDTIWSFAVGLVGIAAALAPIDTSGLGGFWQHEPSARQWLVAVLCGLWGLRLGLHIAARTRGGGDDPRYAKLKADWGAEYAWRFFLFLQVQAAAACVLVASVLAAAHPVGPLSLFDGLGALLLAAAIAGAAVADWQLTQFKRQGGSGRICRIGLWSWSRHPNYFFEWLGWCAYPVIALPHATNAGGAIGLAAALGAPVLMYWLLVHVSGIPPLEAHMRLSRGGTFEAYAAEVSLFWPWPPKRRP